MHEGVSLELGDVLFELVGCFLIGISSVLIFALFFYLM